jgi:hypothetical protein
VLTSPDAVLIVVAGAREKFGITLDLTDIPRDQFVVAGLAWRQCRAGKDDPNRYGLSAVKEFGDWWIAANLIRDVAALSNLELLPWDVWGVMPEPEDEITPVMVELFDALADITTDPETAADSRALYERDDRLRVDARAAQPDSPSGDQMYVAATRPRWTPRDRPHRRG